MKDTDRKLLELAAKAACMESMWDQPRGANWGWFRARMPGTGPAFPVWRPLDDDGDALRLAVKCGIHVTNSETDAWASHLAVTATVPLGPDPCAATRRAIVRAAAEIGKGMA